MRVQHELNKCKNFFHLLSYLIFVKKFRAPQANKLYCITRSAVISQFRYDLGPGIITGSCNGFLHVIIDDAMLLQEVILWTRHGFFVSPVVPHKQILAFFVAWETRSILTALLKPKVCNLFPHIE